MLPIKRTIFLIILFLLFTPALVSAQTHPVINEFSVHPSSGNKEWVEFFVSDSSDLSTYWIDDDAHFTEDSGTSAKKNLASITQGYDSNHWFIEVNSVFNNSGDSIVLFDANGAVIDQYLYESDPGVDSSIGRFPNGTGQFQLLEKSSKGESNSPPAPTPSLTPLPTIRPSNTPKPPTPTKASKTKSSDTPSESASQSQISWQDDTDIPTRSVAVNHTVQETAFSDNEYPTPILGVSTSSARKKEASKSATKKKDEILVQEAQMDLVPIFTSIFGIILIGGGILVYIKRSKK